MKPLKSSSALKADARELLLGKYNVAVFAYVLMELLITGILTIIELQVNLQTTTGLLLYYAVYFIVILLSNVFIVGQNFRKIAVIFGPAYCKYRDYAHYKQLLSVTYRRCLSRFHDYRLHHRTTGVLPGIVPCSGLPGRNTPSAACTQ